jgi:hypothetical protein
MDIIMKKNARKWWIGALLVTVMTLTVACSRDYDDDISNINIQLYDNSLMANGIYEGVWTVDREMVDTAQMVVRDNTVQVRLPEQHLLFMFFSDVHPEMLSGESLKWVNVDYRLHHKPTTIQLLNQGYSETSQYMMTGATTVQDKNLQLFSNTCSFEVTIENTPYLISLLSKENAMAVLQKYTWQWTLGIPVDRFQVKNLATGESTIEQVSSTVLYYNTKRRIK